MGCGCRGTRVVKTKPRSALTSSGNFKNAQSVAGGSVDGEQLVQVEYLGDQAGKFSIRSRVIHSKYYRFNDGSHRVQTVFLRDAEYLVAQTDGQGRSQYRIVTGGTMEHQDPQAALGRAIAG